MKPFEAKRTEEWALPIDGASALRVRTADSAIRVVGAPVEQIQIVAAKRARAATDAEAQAFLDQIRVDRRRDGDYWIVEAAWPEPRAHQVESVSVSFDIQVPTGFNLEARSSNGAIEASGVGEARLRTSNGRITAREIQRHLEAESSNGAIHADGCGGPVHLKTANGRIEVREAAGEAKLFTSNGAIHAEACAGPVEAKTENARIEVRQAGGLIKTHTSNGAIQIDGCPGPVEARTSCGSIAILQAGNPVQALTSEGRIEVELAPGQTAVEAELVTRNSGIDLRLPEGVSARLSAETSNGRIRMEPSFNGQGSAGPTHLQTVLGSGEGSIRLRTSNGPIQIRVAG